jgi:hypothetical protein
LLKLGFDTLEALTRFAYLRFGELAHRRVRSHLLRRAQIVLCAAVGAVQVHDRHDFRMLARQPPVVVEIRRHVFGRQERVDLVQAVRELRKPRGNALFHSREMW